MATGPTSEVLELEQEDKAAPVYGDDELSYGDDESSTPVGKSWLRITIVLLVIAGVVGFAVWKIHANMAGHQPAAGGRRSADRSRSVPVTFAKVQQANMPIYLSALGTVTPYNSVTVKPRVDGELMTVNVREGQSVKKGQLLAEIDPRPYEASLIQAQGQLAKDTASATYTKIESDRYSALFKAGIVSQDSQQSEAATAGQSSGSLLMDQGAVQSAKLNLAYTRILSPIDGVVGLRQVDPGNIVHAADAGGLLLVTQLHPISVVFILPEDQIPEVRKAMKQGTLSVEAYDRSDSTHLGSGKLLTLDNQIDQSTGTDKAKAVFPNSDDALFPNQFVNIRLIIEHRPDALVIPPAAIQNGSSGTFVFVAKAGEPPADGSRSHSGRSHREEASAAPAATPAAAPAEPKQEGKSKSKGGSEKGDSYYAEVRPVVVDVIEGNQAIIKNGLSAGEQVIVDGQEKLQNGSRISSRVTRSKKSDSSGDGTDSKAGSDEAPGAGKGEHSGKHNKEKHS